MNGEGNFSDYEEPATANTIAEDEGPSLIEKSKQKYGQIQIVTAFLNQLEFTCPVRWGRRSPIQGVV